MPEAGITTSLSLPSRYLITPSCPADGIRLFQQQFRQALAAGLRLVRLRPGRLPVDTLSALLSVCQSLCHEYGARLLIDNELFFVLQCPVDGLHLNSQGLRLCRDRPAGITLLAASCHDLDEVQRANRLGVDFIVISPVRETASHPGAKSLGWEGLATLIAAAQMPVFALGGMQSEDLTRVRRLGGQGIAAIRGLWPAR